MVTLASYAIDGNDSTYWYANDQPGDYLKIDLQIPYTIIAFRVLGFDSYQNYTISSSTDGVTYTDRWVGSSGSGWPDAGIQVLTSGAVTARYWRLLTTSGSGGYFGVETFQLLPPASPVALSVGAPGQVLTVSGGLPTWQTPSSNGGGNSPFAHITGGLIVANNATDDFVFGSSAQASGSALFHLYGLNAFAGTQPVASIGAKTSYAALVVDNSGVGDLFTASASGATRFTITQNGSIASTGNLTLAGTTRRYPFR